MKIYDLGLFRLSTIILATGLAIGLNMIINSSIGDYLSGAIIGIAGGIYIGYVYGKGGKK